MTSIIANKIQSSFKVRELSMIEKKKTFFSRILDNITKKAYGSYANYDNFL